MELLLLFAAALAAWFAWRAWRRRRRRAISARPLPDAWRRIMEENIPLYRRLPEELKERLHARVHLFLHDKRFHGMNGLEIDDEIRLTVAGTACILLLGRRDLEFADFTNILVYPSTFVSERREREGLVEHVGRPARLGESWKRGPMVLAWDAARHGAFDVRDGRNVILHEFAHKLDEADGVVDGAPVLDGGYSAWARVMQREFEALQRNAAREVRTVMDHYGATQPAEFFAVLVETFFEKPKQLSEHHPELFEQVRRCFGLDPLAWPEPEGPHRMSDPEALGERQ